MQFGPTAARINSSLQLCRLKQKNQGGLCGISMSPVFCLAPVPFMAPVPLWHALARFFLASELIFPYFEARCQRLSITVVLSQLIRMSASKSMARLRSRAVFPPFFGFLESSLLTLFFSFLLYLAKNNHIFPCFACT